MSKATGLKRLINATRYSYQGLRACCKSEEAFQLELAGALIFIPLGLYLGGTPAEKALLAGSILFLMIVELVNTAIERTVDRISSERHPLAGDAKDMGSAAVMLAVLACALTWGLILFA